MTYAYDTSYLGGKSAAGKTWNQRVNEGSKEFGRSAFSVPLSAISGNGGSGSGSYTVRKSGPGPGSQLMARAELNPQYEADKAATSVQNKAEAAQGAANRRLSAMGIDPGSGRSRTINKNAAIALAAAKAGAANKARRGALEDNWNRMFKSAQLMQRDRSQNLLEDKFSFGRQQYADRPVRWNDYSTNRNESLALREAEGAKKAELAQAQDKAWLNSLSKPQLAGEIKKRQDADVVRRRREAAHASYKDLNRAAGTSSAGYRHTFSI